MMKAFKVRLKDEVDSEVNAEYRDADAVVDEASGEAHIYPTKLKLRLDKRRFWKKSEVLDV